MTDTSERIEQLEQSVRGLRRGIMALAVALGCVVMVGATQPKNLDLTKLRILDDEGKQRFVLKTSPDGGAGFYAYDQNKKQRFGVATLPNGDAGLVLIDTAGKVVWNETSRR